MVTSTPARRFTAETSEFDNAHIVRGPLAGPRRIGGQEDDRAGLEGLSVGTWLVTASWWPDNATVRRSWPGWPGWLGGPVGGRADTTVTCGADGVAADEPPAGSM